MKFLGWSVKTQTMDGDEIMTDEGSENLVHSVFTGLENLRRLEQQPSEEAVEEVWY